MKRLIAKLMAAGIVLSVANTALACDIQTNAPYAVNVEGTGSVGYEGVGHVDFGPIGDGGEGELTGTFAVHFPSHKACISEWNGFYNRTQTALGDLSYDATIVVTGDCLPKAGVKIEMQIEPSNDGSHLRIGTMAPIGDNMQGSGDLQN